MSEKLQKVLARAGKGSRREMEQLISDGRASVDGKVAKLGDRVEESQLLRVDGHIVKTESAEDTVCRVLTYHKPEGELCTRKDPEGRPTVFNRLPRLKNGRWIAVGRLDVNTSGLLIFTTDGELANRLMHPKFEVEREYACRVFGEVTDQKVNNVRKGVELEDGPAKFKSVKASGGEGINRWFNVVLTSGRNREVRRLWESQEVKVSRLIRVRYGEILLEKHLPQGGWAELTLKDVNYLRKMVDLPYETKSMIKVEEGRMDKRTKTARIRRSVRKHQQRQGKSTEKRRAPR
ncbi:MAG: 23S rRNA pseudouridine(2605) synthase RluB [Algicola sp.]|nr:23S rRNA pseudouridine(2605) synthase RluB [Algicola sp.]